MSRAVVTHFDGDPFTLNAWLRLYRECWRGECDKVYMTIYYNSKTVPASVIDYEQTMLKHYPEIVPVFLAECAPPEVGNQRALKTVTEDYVGLIESDGFVYERGIIDQCFRLLEKEGQDIVAPPWFLIDDPYFNGDLQSKGFMRCFTFTKMELLNQTDMDFMPKHIPANTRVTDEYSTSKSVDLDCFGWLSWQLLLLTRKITYTPNNILTPENILSTHSNFKYIHVRQMSSSALGLGGGEFADWAKGDNQIILDRVYHLFNEDMPNGPAEFIYVKSVAFKLLFYDLFAGIDALGDFAKDYRHVLDLVIDYYNLPKPFIYEVKGFYKGLFNI